MSSRSNGTPRHPVPRPGEHLQQRDGQRAEVGGLDGRGDVGRHVHPPRLLRPQRIRNHPQNYSGTISYRYLVSLLDDLDLCTSI